MTDLNKSSNRPEILVRKNCFPKTNVSEIGSAQIGPVQVGFSASQLVCLHLVAYSVGRPVSFQNVQLVCGRSVENSPPLSMDTIRLTRCPACKEPLRTLRLKVPKCEEPEKQSKLMAWRGGQ